MDGIAESGIAIEVSTAGLRKPVGELYPDRAFLEMCLDAGCPVALSSDAHHAEHLGYGYDDRARAARRHRRHASSPCSRAASDAWSRSGPRSRDDDGVTRVRTGIGWDSHRLEPGRPLILGGVRLEHPELLGLAGHSDADVLTHAVIDALLGAAGARRHRHALPGHRRALARRRLARAAARRRGDARRARR